MSTQEFTVAISRWDWDSLRIFGDHGEVAGHRIKIGSVAELQLSVPRESVYKYWTKKRNKRREWIIDPSYENDLVLDLGQKSESMRRTIQPLRPRTNLAYFEAVVTGIAQAASKVEEKKIVNVLLDSGVPIIIEAVTGETGPSPLAAFEGDEIIGICGLTGNLSSSGALIKAPLNAKVINIISLEARPKMVLLTVQVAPRDSIPDTKIDYYRLDGGPSATPAKK